MNTMTLKFSSSFKVTCDWVTCFWSFSKSDMKTLWKWIQAFSNSFFPILVCWVMLPKWLFCQPGFRSDSNDDRVTLSAANDGRFVRSKHLLFHATKIWGSFVITRIYSILTNTLLQNPFPFISLLAPDFYLWVHVVSRKWTSPTLQGLWAKTVGTFHPLETNIDSGLGICYKIVESKCLSGDF